MSHLRSSFGIGVFGIVWCGQLVSLIGSGLTSFVLGLWVYQITGSVTQFALILFSGALPRILFSPLAGALVDRWDRRQVMMLSDAAAGLSILAVALLFFTHRLAVWHIYLATAVGALCGAFQLPAYIAVTTLLVPRQNLSRANGLLQLGLATQDVIAPALAGILLTTIQTGGVLLIDVCTFFVAVFTLFLVKFPPTPSTSGDQARKGSLFREAVYGWNYIMGRPGLLGLLLFFGLTSFLNGMIGALIYPLILAFNSTLSLGLIISIAGGGLMLSSLIMSAWNGPRRRIAGVLGAEFVFGLGILLIGLRPSLFVIAIGAVIAHMALPVSNVTNLAIWQSKVSPGLQGRVFAMRQMVGRAAALLAFVLAGPLADTVFGPLLAVHGPLAGSLGRLICVGPGRGIGLMFLLMGVLALMVSIVGYLHPRLRLVEHELPDAIEIPPAPVSVGVGGM